MSHLFGVPYMGSKTKIALDILKQLPKCKRFVDLFGGGFAMSHAALLTDKYEKILYNDINPLITNLVKRAINGEFNYKVFKPKWISREDFKLNKDKDGYIKYCWSFGNNGKGYLFWKEIESFKRAIHNLVVFNEHSDLLPKEIYKHITSTNIHDRRLQVKNYFKFHKKRVDAQQLEQLERLQQLERLERLQQLERLNKTIEMSNISYDKYEYQEGDIVYLDPPYENTGDYGEKFDSQKFYDWCYSKPYKVWFSSYKISDKRFKLIFAKQLRTSLSVTNNNCINFECLYTNK